MAQQVWILNLTGASLTLPYGTSVGVSPQLMDPGSLDYSIGVTNGQIVQISSTLADTLLAVTRTQLVGSKVTNVTLANTVTAAGVQTPVTVGNNKTLLVEAYGTAAGFTVAIQGISASGTAYPMPGTQVAAPGLASLTSVSQITGAGLYQFDVTGMVSVEANVVGVGTISNPSAALTLAASGSGSAFAAGTVYVQNDFTNSFGRTTTGTSQSSISVTLGQNVTTSVTLEAGATGIGVYVGTASNPVKLADVSSTGVITYSGSAASGLAVTVNGSTLNLTISGSANGGSAALTTATATGNVSVAGELVAS